ncbi:MAG: YihY/virulence factor BrkB family protein [Proteobacteria bacterium]|nr:YihY/virulence factor BrkB family protein [Pseudomonadota bacterium]
MKYWIKLSRDVLFEAFRSFFSDDCPNLAAAIAFYSILSVIPIIFFILFASGLVLGSSESAYITVVEFVKELHPYIEEKLLLGIKNLSETSGVMGWIGFAFLLWISTMIFSSLEVAFTTIFRTKKTGHPLKSMLVAMAVVPAGVIAILFSIAIHVAASMIKDTGVVLLGVNIGNLVINNALVRHIVPISSVILFFTFVFKIIPNKKIYFSHALMGGVICSVLLEIAKQLFGLYLSYGGSPAGFVYGPLKALIYLVLWVFYLASIILLTAEILSVFERKTKKG